MRLRHRPSVRVPAILALLAPSAWAQGPAFRTSAIPSSAPSPNAIVVDEFDGDPGLDILVGDVNGLFLLRSDGQADPTFAEQPLLLGASISALDAGPINGDATPDIVFNSSVVNELTVLYVTPGSDPVQFTAQDITLPGIRRTNVVVADVDGDGDGDIVTASDTTVYTVRNDGGGSFTVLSDPGYTDIGSVTVADVDGEGPKVIVAELVPDGVDEFSTLVYLGERLILDLATPAALATTPRHLGVGDVLTGPPPEFTPATDIVLAARGLELVLSNDGMDPPSFLPFTLLFFNATDPDALIVADLDGDGLSELIGDTDDPSDLDVLFLAAGLSAIDETCDSPDTLAAGDLDGDGDLDLVAGFSSGDPVRWYRLDQIVNQTSGEQFVLLEDAIAAAQANDTLLTPSEYLQLELAVELGAGQPLTLEADGPVTRRASYPTTFLAPGLTLDTPPGSPVTLGPIAVEPNASVLIDAGGGPVRLGNPVTLGAGASLTAAGPVTVGEAGPVLDFGELVGVGGGRLAVLDLDGDGSLDIADGETWYIADGTDPANGTVEFTPVSIGQALGAAAGRSSVFADATVDLNGDGAADAVADIFASPFDRRLSWFEGDGAIPPTFIERPITNSFPSISGVRVADLTGDGLLDIGIELPRPLDFYENLGGDPPTFARRTNPPPTHEIESYEFVDLNGDGLTDVLASQPSADTIAWFRNDPAAPGTFIERVITAGGTNTPTLRAAPADLDGDGDLDVVTLIGENVVWFENDGSATPPFPQAVLVADLPGAETVWPADLTGDGAIDLVATGPPRACGQPDDDVILVNDGAPDPSFSRTPTLRFGGPITQAIAADLNADGVDDLVAGLPDDDGLSEEWYYFEVITPSFDLGLGAELTALIGLTLRADTRLDGGTIATGLGAVAPAGVSITGYGSFSGGLESAGVIRVENAGEPALLQVLGDLTLMRESPAARAPELVLPLGGIDVVANSTSQVAVGGTATLTGRLRLVANPGFDPQIGESFTLLTAPSIVGTFDNISLPDVADDRFLAVDVDPGTLRPDGTRAAGSVTVEVLPLGGDVGFSEPQGSDIGGAGGVPTDAELFDIDLDGDLDLLISLPDPGDALVDPGSVVVLYNDPNPQTGEIFGPAEQILTGVGVNPSGVAAGRLDGDAQPDIVVSNRGAPTDPGPDTVSVFLIGDPTPGALSFTAVFAETVDDQPADVAIDDLDQDGLNDLATANAGGGSVTLALNNGMGQGPAWQRVDPEDIELPEDGVCPLSIRPGDTDAGLRFLATANADADTVGIVRVFPDGSALALPSIPVGNEPVELAVGDVTGDGLDDIVTVNRAGGSVSVVRNTSAGTALAFADAVEFPLTVQLQAPPSLALGNLDAATGDTDIDIAVVVDGVVRVLRNDTQNPSQPAFTELQNQPAGPDPLIVRAGDVNNDDRDDLVTVGEADATGGRGPARHTQNPVNVLLSTPAPGCPGDVNLDGATDVFDFAALADNFGAGPGAVFTQGDLTGEGRVDIFDFAALADDFGCDAG